MTLSNANSEDMTLVVVVTLKSLQCKYFDAAADVWETRGCTVINSTSQTTVCRCDRVVAQFGLSEMPVSARLIFQPVPVLTTTITAYASKRNSISYSSQAGRQNRCRRGKL